MLLSAEEKIKQKQLLMIEGILTVEATETVTVEVSEAATKAPEKFTRLSF